MHDTYSVKHILLDLPTITICGEENKLLIFSLHTQFSPTSCYLLPLRFKYSLQQNSKERSLVLWLYRPLFKYTEM